MCMKKNCKYAQTRTHTYTRERCRVFECIHVSPYLYNGTGNELLCCSFSCSCWCSLFFSLSLSLTRPHWSWMH